VTGRRVSTDEVGSLGAGRHALELAPGVHLAPGLYLVRFRQGSHVEAVRAAVLN
jgi:hypothetical protein